MPKAKSDEDKLKTKDILMLILVSYRATLPYILIFALVMLLSTYLVAEFLLQ